VQLADFKDESERKFALQIAENKRLSVQMSSQKKENQRLIERIHVLEERVKRLEIDIGDDL
jgi:cell division protein FtsB